MGRQGAWNGTAGPSSALLQACLQHLRGAQLLTATRDGWIKSCIGSGAGRLGAESAEQKHEFDTVTTDTTTTTNRGKL